MDQACTPEPGHQLPRRSTGASCAEPPFTHKFTRRYYYQKNRLQAGRCLVRLFGSQP